MTIEPSHDHERYIIEMECGHQRRTTFPPLGQTYPCGECRCTRLVTAHTDTHTGTRTPRGEA